MVGRVHAWCPSTGVWALDTKYSCIQTVLGGQDLVPGKSGSVPSELWCEFLKKGVFTALVSGLWHKILLHSKGQDLVPGKSGSVPSELGCEFLKKDVFAALVSGLFRPYCAPSYHLVPSTRSRPCTWAQAVLSQFWCELFKKGVFAALVSGL